MRWHLVGTDKAYLPKKFQGEVSQIAEKKLPNPTRGLKCKRNIAFVKMARIFCIDKDIL